jgi:hypothetical protein
MIPDALRQQLQLLLEHQPMVKQIISYLPGDLQRVAGTPEGLLALLLTAAVGLLILLALTSSSKSKRGSSIVIAGPMNAGKSTLYYQLVDGSQHNGLVASMEQNTGRPLVCINKQMLALHFAAAFTITQACSAKAVALRVAQCCSLCEIMEVLPGALHLLTVPVMMPTAQQCVDVSN